MISRYLDDDLDWLTLEPPTKAATPDYILEELDGADEDGDQFEEALEDYGDDLPEARIEQAAKTGSQWVMEQAVNLTALGLAAAAFWQPRVAQAAQERTREFITDEWPKDLPPFGGGAQPGVGPRRGELQLRFNQMDARAEEWASREAGRLVTHVTDSEKDRIAELIARANREGLTVDRVARELRWVGLLPQHQTAVARYQRELADEGRPMEQVFRMADKYRRSLLNFRTRMIARQELLTATHQGQLAAILDAVHHAEIDPSQTSRVWVVADDERLCPLCAYMDGQTVQADEPWVTEDGESIMIPQEIHIQCRCSWELVTEYQAPEEEAALAIIPIMKDWDEGQHPRDEAGRFTDAGGGDFSPEAEAADTARLDEFNREMTAYGRTVADQLGFPPEDVEFAEYVKPFKVGTQEFHNEAGHYDPGEGKITINLTEINNKEDLLGVMSHEIQHNRFHTVMDVYDAEKFDLVGDARDVMKPDGSLKPGFEKEYPTYAAIQPIWEGRWDELKTYGHITDYAGAYWKAAAEKVDVGGGHGVTVKLAANETLAEMAKINQTTGQIVGADAWRDFYKTVNKEADNIKRRSSW